MNWQDVIPVAVADAARIEHRVPALREQAHTFVRSKEAAYFWDPVTDRVGVQSSMSADREELLKIASVFGPTRAQPISPEELAAPDCRLVKVAHSQALRTIGEWGNFFPGHYPGGIPNHPSPLAAMLTSGLAGAGLGWGAGKLIEKIMPEGYGHNLGRSGALLGGGLGAGLGGIWGASNLARGRSFNDNSLFTGAADPAAPDFINGLNSEPPPSGEHPSGVGDYLRTIVPYMSRRRVVTAGDNLDVPLSDYCAPSIAHFVKAAYGGTMGDKPAPRSGTPLDVNINALGQTLWDVAAPPSLTAATMGAMYAASQLPDERGRPGWATTNQLGQLAERSGSTFQQGALAGLATNAIADYLKGTLGGVALNTVVGTPYAATTFGAINAGLGALQNVVSGLWG